MNLESNRAAAAQHRIQLYVNGGTVDGTGARFDTLNPATQQVLGEGNAASDDDVARAIASATEGQRVWAKTPGAQRRRVLRKAADLLRAGVETLAALEVRDSGKPITEARSADIPSAADAIEHVGGLASTIAGEQIDLVTAFVYTRREPLGVCAGIGAWNYPIQIISRSTFSMAASSRSRSCQLSNGAIGPGWACNGCCLIRGRQRRITSPTASRGRTSICWGASRTPTS